MEHRGRAGTRGVEEEDGGLAVGRRGEVGELPRVLCARNNTRFWPRMNEEEGATRHLTTQISRLSRGG